MFRIILIRAILYYKFFLDISYFSNYILISQKMEKVVFVIFKAQRGILGTKITL